MNRSEGMRTAHTFLIAWKFSLRRFSVSLGVSFLGWRSGFTHPRWLQFNFHRNLPKDAYPFRCHDLGIRFMLFGRLKILGFGARIVTPYMVDSYEHSHDWATSDTFKWKEHMKRYEIKYFNWGV